MYLKEIKFHGFKSFADKTMIELDNKITGIVGPNGSGKSNVVDAVRWVLGEQSIKSLRGDGNMTDVIFSGSKSRNASNVASVSLVFDNTDHYLPLDFSEVSIKRRVYKDATNEYFINNEKVRLKDITDMLLDSGSSREAFNIISQGKIETILSNKPEERRIIFEEAAGVLKYKKRKEDALRKLDKTHLNLNRINDIIIELEANIKPLEKQREAALKYKTINDELSNLEISLITDDITNLNYEYQMNKIKVNNLNDEISNISVTNNTNEVKIEKYKQQLNQIGILIKEKQASLTLFTQIVEQLNSRKNIILERQKYESKDLKLHDNIVNLKEKELLTKNEINNLKISLTNITNEINDLVNKANNEQSYLNSLKSKRNQTEDKLRLTIKDKNSCNLKIETLRHSIDNNSTVPYAVKQVLDNPKLAGVHDIVGNLFEVEEKYSLAITTVMGASVSNIVVENEIVAKECIYYLKNNKLGRATFYPLNIIKPKTINFEGLIASNLVKCMPVYQNIIDNLLGNVLVVNNIDEANILAKKVDYRYRIVTLDGEILHVGGSLSGGINKNRNIITDKYELENSLKGLGNLEKIISSLEENINEIDNNIRTVEDKIYIINKNKLDRTLIFDSFNKKIIELENTIHNLIIEINGTNNIINGSLKNEEELILNEYYGKLNQKDKINLELTELFKKEQNIKEELSDYELSLKKENSLFNEKVNNLKELEILVNRLDVKLDNLLNSLSENYNLTYEAATLNYKLDIPSNIARTKVNNFKKLIKEFGIVNLGSIEEYERIKNRYDFLLKQKVDLNNAENTLLEIIGEMDKVMSTEFINTFKIIRENFSITFKELFKGGSADLKLTDPNNVLETGIEIIASPPGKSVKTISLLSGGEKTFTAISLLFAILKSKPVPYCILDEVEAALDETNVEHFGEYLHRLKDKTQFILITHKKKTMEYVDTLYGITMQESGVSKLVSVKLEEI